MLSLPRFYLLVLALLPFVSYSFAAEQHEVYRLAYLGIFLALALPQLPWRQWRFQPAEKRTLWAMAFWAIVIITSSILALHPLEALLGDFTRNMGAWSRLALLGAFCLSLNRSVAEHWRWLWLAGVAVALGILLEYPSLADGARPVGVLGWATYSGGWLMMCLIWSVALIWHERPRYSLVYGLGCLLMAGALILGGARAATLGAVVGLLVLGGLALAIQKRWRTLLVLVGLGFALLGLGAGLSRLDWSNSPFATNVFSRIDLLNFDEFRQRMWTSATTMFANMPALVHADGQSDALSAWRPIIGYGLESFNYLYESLPLEEGYYLNIVDRVHNDTYDTLFSMGVVGMVAQLVLWGSLYGLALWRLGWHAPAAYLLPALGISIAWLSTSHLFYAPLLTYLAGLLGALIWMLWAALRRSSQLQLNALLVLALLAAHLLELQFGFVTFATSILLWCAAGTLFQPLGATHSEAHQTPSEAPSTAHYGILIGALGGALALRQAVIAGNLWWIGITITLIVGAYLLQAWHGKQAWLWVLGAWLWGILSGQFISPLANALLDGSFLALVLVWAFGWQAYRRNTSFAFSAFILVIAYSLNVFAYSNVWLARNAEQVDDSLPNLAIYGNWLHMSAQIRLWDAELSSEAASMQARFGTGTANAVYLSQALQGYDIARQLQGYNARIMENYSTLLYSLSQMSDDPSYAQRYAEAYATSLQMRPRIIYDSESPLKGIPPP